jgi:hypothetical protein
MSLYLLLDIKCDSMEVITVTMSIFELYIVIIVKNLKFTNPLL